MSSFRHNLISIPSFRGLFIIDKSGVLRQITVNDLPVGRDVDETLRLVQVKTGLGLDKLSRTTGLDSPTPRDSCL